MRFLVICIVVLSYIQFTNVGVMFLLIFSSKELLSSVIISILAESLNSVDKLWMVIWKSLAITFQNIMVQVFYSKIIQSKNFPFQISMFRIFFFRITYIMLANYFSDIIYLRFCSNALIFNKNVFYKSGFI